VARFLKRVHRATWYLLGRPRDAETTDVRWQGLFAILGFTMALVFWWADATYDPGVVIPALMVFSFLLGVKSTWAYVAARRRLRR